MKLIVEGQEPLVGRVKLSGSRNASIKLIMAALFSNDEVLLENIPKVDSVTAELDILKSLGVDWEWVSSNKLRIDSSSITSSKIPFDIASRFRTSMLLAGPLLYRFGRVSLPKPLNTGQVRRPLNRWLETWQTLGFSVKEDENYIHLEIGRQDNSEINFRVSTVMGTENAIFSSIFQPGETVINNAAEEPEIDDLISFLVKLGAVVKRVDERKIVVEGTKSFKGGRHTVMSDRIEAVNYAVCALLTHGDIEIEGIDSASLLPFMRKLEKLKASFEFRDNVLRIWKTRGQVLEATDIETAPAPGFISDWQPPFTVLLTQCAGVGLIHETVYVDRFSYIKELNRMGAKVALLKPSEAGLETMVSDDSYDIAQKGEPLTVAKIEGPTPLRREKVGVTDSREGAALLLAALAAEGRSEIYNAEFIFSQFENMDSKLKSLGAVIQLLN